MWNYVGLKWVKCVGVVGIVGEIRIWNCGLWWVNGGMGGIMVKTSGECEIETVWLELGVLLAISGKVATLFF